MLSMRWSAVWSSAPSAPVAELSPDVVSTLERYLAQPRAPAPGRDLFSREAGGGTSASNPAAVAVREPEIEAPAATRVESEAMDEIPVLTGFVLARPELESDVRRRVLAAVRYGGELLLVKVGDDVGSYVVDRIEARESITLFHAATGETLLLRLP